MKRYIEVEIEETTVKTYKINIEGSIGETLEYIGAHINSLERDHNPHGETREIGMLAICLREDK
jgi:hypothetical protein